MTNPSNIAAIANHEGLDSQALLSRMAADWRASGIRVVGILAQNTTFRVSESGFVRDIASGKQFSIHLDRRCRTHLPLDAAGMEDAGSGLLGQIAEADVVVFSKFGKLEAMQGGLWPAFSAAVKAGKPLLTTVSSKHVEAWRAFVPAATWIEGKTASVEQWWRMVHGSA